MWLVVNKIANRIGDKDIINEFAVRARCIYSAEKHNNGYYNIVLNDGTTILCEGDFNELVAYLGEENDEA